VLCHWLASLVVCNGQNCTIAIWVPDANPGLPSWMPLTFLISPAYLAAILHTFIQPKQSLCCQNIKKDTHTCSLFSWKGAASTVRAQCNYLGVGVAEHPLSESVVGQSLNVFANCHSKVVANVVLHVPPNGGSFRVVA
jgi:hypothetical protein